MTSEEREKMIATYKDGYEEVLQSLKDLPEQSLTAHPIEGKWSAAEIVHHLADSETTSALRLRRLLVEDHPLIQGYDQDAFAADRKSTRLNSSHSQISYAVFCLKKKK